MFMKLQEQPTGRKRWVHSQWWIALPDSGQKTICHLEMKRMKHIPKAMMVNLDNETWNMGLNLGWVEEKIFHRNSHGIYMRCYIRIRTAKVSNDEIMAKTVMIHIQWCSVTKQTASMHQIIPKQTFKCQVYGSSNEYTSHDDTNRQEAWFRHK